MTNHILPPTHVRGGILYVPYTILGNKRTIRQLFKRHINVLKYLLKVEQWNENFSSNFPELRNMFLN